MRSSIEAVLIAAVLAMAAAAYWPGTGGGFILDDHDNLKLLAHVPAYLGVAELVAHAWGDISGLTRFLPRLTFVLQRASWPDAPGDLIVVNLLLHAANACLVYLVCRTLARMAGSGAPRVLALGAAAFWLLHPLQVSGVLYVIQRINQMSTFFVLAGMSAYLHGRTLSQERPRAAYGWMSGGLLAGGGLALLSKENAVLMPLLVLVLEATLLRRLAHPPRWNQWRAVFLYFPLLILAAGIALNFQSWVLAGYAQREFGLVERLATEARALAEYLLAIIVPRLQGLGPFHDDYPVIAWPPGILEGIQAAAGLGALACGLLLRRRLPVLGFTLLWFFAGHALESSFLPLELYFEHRNYLPLLGPAYGFGALIAAAVSRAGVLRHAFLVVAVAWLGLLAWMTHQQARLWGNPPIMAATLASEHPDSLRAQLFQAQMQAANGWAEAAVAILREVTEGRFHRPDYYPGWIYLGCLAKLPMPDPDRVGAALEREVVRNDALNNLSRLADAFEHGICPRVEPRAVRILVERLLANPLWRVKESALLTVKGRLLLLEGDPAGALASFDRAYELAGDVEVAFLGVKALHAAGRRSEALRRLAEIRRRIETGGPSLRRYRGTLEHWEITVGRLAAN